MGDATAAQQLAVWALRTDFVRFVGGELGGDLTLELITVPHSSNTNLHAQAGVFTLTKTGIDGVEQYRPLDTVIELAKEERATSQGLPASHPVSRPLRRITMPRTAAAELLRRLHDERVSAATLFPGYSGVSRSLEDEAGWDRISPDARTIRDLRGGRKKIWGL